MKISVERITPDEVFKQACLATLPAGFKSRVTFEKMLACEHSPIRVVDYWIVFDGIPAYVSTHFVRHHVGVDGPFVTSYRQDRHPDASNQEAINRMTPVRHAFKANAQALINISRKRLCLNSDKRTVAVMAKLRRAMMSCDQTMAKFMVPECVYRNGMCPELRECKAGVDSVCSAYPAWPGKERGVIEE